MRARAGALIIVAILMASSGGQTSASAGSFPGANGKIAFASEGHIEVINGDGTGRRTLDAASPASSVNEPAWNAAGTKLAFRGGGSSISTMRADGRKSKLLVTMPSFAGNPSWSRDGSVVAFDGYIGGINQENRIFTVQAAGGTAAELVALDAADPTYSPDGTKIAFEFDESIHAIGVMNADGSGAANITPGGSGNAGDYDPSWSPDGSKIAFKRAFQIWTMNADGSVATQLTTGTDDSYPTWSPDGTKIAFERDDDIWVMDRDGSDATNITNTPDEDEKGPDWGICTGANCPPPPPSCTISWDGGAGTKSWHDAANWEGDVLPGAGDDVCILHPDSLSVTRSGRSILSSHSDVVLSDNVTTRINSLFADQAVWLEGGVLELLSPTRVSHMNFVDEAHDPEHPAFEMFGGELTGAGTLEVTSLNWTGGTMSGAGDTVIDPPVSVDGLTGPVGVLAGATKKLIGGRDFFVGSGELPPMEPPDGDPPDMEPPDGEPPPMEPPDVEWRAGDIVLSGGSEIVNNGYIRVTDSVDLAEPEGAELVGFTNNGTLEMKAEAKVFGVEAGNDFTSNGSLRVIAGTVDIRGAFTNFDAAARTLSGGTYVVADTLSFTDAALGRLSGDVILTDTGRILDHLGNNALSFLEGIDRCCKFSLRDGYDLTTDSAFSNSGDVFIGTDSVLEAGGVYTQDRGTTVLVDRTSVLETAEPISGIVLDGGSLSGIGTVGANMINSAKVAPGLSPGTLTIDGDYTQKGSGNLTIEIAGKKAGSGYDRLDVTGAADLSGKVVLKVTGGFKPKAGQSYKIDTFDSRTGKFSRVTVKNLSKKLKFKLKYTKTSVVVNVKRK